MCRKECSKTTEQRNQGEPSSSREVFVDASTTGIQSDKRLRIRATVYDAHDLVRSICFIFKTGGGRRDRTADLRVMNPSL